MNKYIINTNTLFIKQKNNKVYIYEKEIVEELEEITTNKIVEESCIYYGCPYKGRKEGTKTLINESYKLPIFISEVLNIIAFPLISERNASFTWIFYNQVESYVRYGNSKVLVEFKNGKKEMFYVSYYIFHNQILKCSRFLIVYRSRNQEFSLK